MIRVNACDTCGSKIHPGCERFHDVAGVHAGIFGGPAWFPIRVADSKHNFLDEAR